MAKPDITKAKWKDERVEIHAEEMINEVDTKSIILKCGDEPAPAFRKAFENLVGSVREILELKPEQWDDRITVTGVSWSLSDAGVEGAVITGAIHIDTADAPFNFNTPHLPFEQYSATGKSKLMPKRAQSALAVLKREALAYLDGKRAQGDMFDARMAAAGDGEEARPH
jgi:hypothetical protein